MIQKKQIRPMRNILFGFGLLLILVLQVSCRQNPYKQGAILYTNFCESCHMENGEGLRGVIPPLAGSDYLARDPAYTACLIRYGQRDTIVVNGRIYNEVMEPIPQLTDFEIANIINYISHSWGNDLGYTSVGKVREALESCSK